MLTIGGLATPASAASTVSGAGGSSSAADVSELEGQALASLRAAYTVLITGVIASPLVAARSEIGVARTAGERGLDLLFRRDFNRKHGLTFTGATVSLRDTSVETDGDRLILRAVEEVKLPFRTTTRPADPARDVTEMHIPHAFVFARVGASWVLEFDDVEGFRDGGSAPGLGGPPPAKIRDVTAPRGTTRTGGQASAMSIIDGPSTMTVSAYGTYNGTAAGDYAYNWALSRNPAYRDFSGSGGDCTNFASQALEAGGWTDKPGWPGDWNNWWYDWYDQTTSWTYVPAMKQFVYTSGRGQALSYLNDLIKGDMMQVDFGGNGSWDHTAIVDSRYSSNLGDIYVSYHTTDTRHRAISDFLASYPIPQNHYMAWKIIATSN